ncbi:diguanylate cyclase [Sphingopyxis panaciterrae]|uniref:GGDEF domain-containing protein n=1 Tax=Sphingopyxis panaciterrae TaxID=363841 RepID=UPI0014229B9E|nr:GGDEF domain-containing protein [Sphingopyxis panaciterrae]NIJ37139.1 diguanylate cyclase [Sphingopyxis panaciterrae]
MTIKATSSNEPVGRLLDWLGLRNPHSGAPIREIPPPGGRATGDLAQQARHRLAQAIMSFLLDHDLDISASNLSLAHSVFSGTNPGLARRINARIASGEGISQSWLDELAKEEAAALDHSEIDRIVARLESNLDAFQTHTKAARSVTSDYGSELERHVLDLEHLEHLEQVQKTGQLVSNLADLAKVMLERTRRAEDDMRKSEDEAKALRRSLARARRDAEIDYLTGLPNRRAFEVLLERHHAEARGACEPLSVAFCDIDEFKRVNDIHGHEAGDRVIKLIADTLSKISDDHCHVARHGGEEFVMLFRGLPPSEAAKRLDEARQELAERRLINRKTDEPFGQITFSGGVADVFGYSEVREALKAADDALYRAKQAGRNRIELA